MSKPAVRYLVFDIESVADGALVSKLRYPGQGLSAADAVRRYRDELIAKYETDFIPYTFQVPVSVVVAKVAADFSLIDIVALDEPQFRSHIITENFWRGWEVYKRPTLVSFNGRSFDLRCRTGRVSLRHQRGDLVQRFRPPRSAAESLQHQIPGCTMC